MIKKGSKVKVVNTGKLYSAYRSFIMSMPTEHWKAGHTFINESTCKKGTIAKVIYIAKHDDANTDIAIIELDNMELIMIAVEGLKEIKEYNLTMMDLDMVDGNKYEDSNEISWKVEDNELYTGNITYLTDYYSFKQIQELRFCRVE